VWGPLLRGKFGDRAEDIAMSWLWSKLTLRRRLEGKEARQELLGYPRSSFEPLFRALQEEIEARGGRVLIDRPAALIESDGGAFLVTAGAEGSFRRGHDPAAFERDGAPERYDAVIATTPSDVFERLLAPGLAAALAPGYAERLRAIDYHTALCLLLELDRDFSGYYWTNIADERLPFVGLVEHTRLVDPARYDGRRFLYVANYLAAGDPLLELDADALLEHYEPGLRLINPAYDRSWIRARWRHAEPAAQPIVTVGYPERMPALATGIPRLVLANTTQIYPEDRGTNYSVSLGERAAVELQAQG
jgi:protoporphyrinogen oxidase